MGGRGDFTSASRFNSNSADDSCKSRQWSSQLLYFSELFLKVSSVITVTIYCFLCANHCPKCLYVISQHLSEVNAIMFTLV